jgi:hypothetical protein
MMLSLAVASVLRGSMGMAGGFMSYWRLRTGPSHLAAGWRYTTGWAVIEERFDEQAERTRALSAKSTDSKPSQGNTAVVWRLEATPTVAKPRDEIEIKLTYDVLAPISRTRETGKVNSIIPYLGATVAAY